MSDTTGPDWFLRDWLRYFGKKQASLVNELGWTKGRANQVWHSEIPYRREVLNEIAAWLELQPFELLMPPHEAMRLRTIRKIARQLAEEDAPFEGAPTEGAKR